MSFLLSLQVWSIPRLKWIQRSHSSYLFHLDKSAWGKDRVWIWRLIFPPLWSDNILKGLKEKEKSFFWEQSFWVIWEYNWDTLNHSPIGEDFWGVSLWSLGPHKKLHTFTMSDNSNIGNLSVSSFADYWACQYSLTVPCFHVALWLVFAGNYLWEVFEYLVEDTESPPGK